jgi:hypothetical protein
MKNPNVPLPDDNEITTADIAKKEKRFEEKRAEVVPFHGSTAETTDERVPLFQQNEAGDLKHRWESIQTAFVDNPRNAVEEADKLVASAIKRIAEGFANERAKLEGQWSRGEQISTEDLRVVLQRYRSFFSRLLSL